MTKLMQWLFLLSIYGIFYVTALTETLPLSLTENGKFVVAISPIILVGLFGIYSVFVILYRVATFNDCEKAAEELKKQIVEAKKDLSSKGLKFD
ncbi:dolichol-phosphate mannosyltransferase subunit 3-like [Clytia hemisphaerica]|uniref:dolichol-phosphate mannosyltransferase subunit 3-like n=1 Tax=Clytia hemisphaerica TaxID=252671 RepID=UPI0034D5A91D